MDINLSTLTLTQAREMLRSGELEHIHLAEACYRQIERLEPTLNAFITVLSREEGQAGTASQGPLGGIPLALKDLFATAGVRTTSGTTFFQDHVPAEDAFVVQKLKAAGGTLVGKTNTHEIALGVTNLNPHFGACRNPWDPSRISGGSSGGSAAAVAAGMCLGALGTDTGGSIRIPASLCGVVGLKPTYGRVSLHGVTPLSWNLDHAGPLARSVQDIAALLGVMAGYDPQDPACKDIPVDDYLKGSDSGLRGWKIALVSGDFLEAADSQVLQAVQEAGQVFQDLGARVQEVEISWLHAAARANGLLVQADAAAFHRERLETRPEGFGADVRQRLEEGRTYTSTQYALARRTQVEVRWHSAATFREYDLLLLPTTPVPAQPIEDIQNSARQAPALTRFTAPFNLSGAPALSLPCGFTAEGLPIGLQIVGAPWREGQVLRAAHAYELVSGWHKRSPPLLSSFEGS